MPGFPEYDSFDALGLGELVRAGQISSGELVEECISRIEKVNPHINSVVFELFEAARARSAAGSTKSTSGWLPAASCLQVGQIPQGGTSALPVQLAAIASRSAIMRLPTPSGPSKR